VAMDTSEMTAEQLSQAEQDELIRQKLEEEKYKASYPVFLSKVQLRQGGFLFYLMGK